MDCGIFTSKTVLLFLSLVFWAAGAALAYVGAYVIRSYDNFDNFIQDRYTLIPAAIIIGISVVMFIFGLVGCCATIRESKVGLGFFFVIIMLIFVAEVAALVFGFIYQGKQIKGDLERSMNEVFSKYDGQDTETKAVDYLQNQQLQCCGVWNHTSWANTTWSTSHNGTAPLSCCKNTSSAVCTGRLDQPELLKTEQGCEAKLENLLQGVLVYAMLVILGFAIIKLFGMLSVCVITCKNGTRRSGYQPLYA
uniref:Tetraspanin n=1 Tax=Mola mola TaxID=94237 RepID=A0A3Q3VWA4_MOLML